MNANQLSRKRNQTWQILILMIVIFVFKTYCFGQSPVCEGATLEEDVICIKTYLDSAKIELKDDLELVEYYFIWGDALMAPPPPLTRRFQAIQYYRYWLSDKYDLLVSENSSDTFLLAHYMEAVLDGKTIYFGNTSAKILQIDKMKNKVFPLAGINQVGFLELNGNYYAMEGKWKRPWHFWLTKSFKRAKKIKFKSKKWMIRWILVPI